MVYVDLSGFMPLLTSTPVPYTILKGASFGDISPLHAVDEQRGFPFQVGMAPVFGRPLGITRDPPFNNAPPIARPEVNAGCPAL
jgi:hypothetical protein